MSNQETVSIGSFVNYIHLWLNIQIIDMKLPEGAQTQRYKGTNLDCAF